MTEKALYYEDVNVGDELPPLVKEITSVSMVMYAAATWDFHRYHHDGDFARGKGMRASFLDGQEMGGFLAQQVVDWAGVDAILKRLAFRYTNFVFGGDTLTCKGRVSSKSEEEGQGMVECELWIENQKGERVLDQGKAKVALPTRGKA